MADLPEDQDPQDQEHAPQAAREDQDQIPKGYSSSSSSKLNIRATKYDDDDQGDLQKQQQQQQLKTCSECGKQFTSGKALGGHKRACLQKKNRIKPSIIVKNNKSSTAVQQEEDGDNQAVAAAVKKNECFVCQQRFKSEKSLYGHMRKHPERNWRGVQPPKGFLSPSNHNNTSASPSHQHSHHDGGGSGDGSDYCAVPPVKGWSAKRKRGHRLKMSSSSLSSSPYSKDNYNNQVDDKDEDKSMEQAVIDLLSLGTLCAARDSINNSVSKSKKRVGSGYGLLKVTDRKKKKKKIDDDDDDGGGGGLGFGNCSSENTWVYDDDYDYHDGDRDKVDMMTNQQRRRRLNELGDDVTKEEPATMVTPPPPTQTTTTYACPVCNKKFDKHQALGGHVASHNKNKINFFIGNKDSSSSDGHEKQKVVSASIAEAAADEGGTAKVVAAGGGEHRCNQCNKKFATGQALGGHKRCHYWNVPADPPAFSSSKSQVTNNTNSAGEVTQAQAQPTRRVHDFDLNDTPFEYYQFHGLEAAAATAPAHHMLDQ